MRPRSMFRISPALLLAWTLAVPPELAAKAVHAGEVSQVVPAVNIQRGQGQLTAVPSTPVFWEDVVNTARLGRARVALDDGSILNVGSQASLRVVKHDAGRQQSELDLIFGRVRARAVRLVKPGASFEIRTPIGTAGVVGTDFFLAYENDILRLIVFEGAVRFCNLAGVCVTAGAGMMSAIRGSESPDTPVPTPTADVLDAVSSTEIAAAPGRERPPALHHHSPWYYVGMISAVAIPAIVIPVTSSSNHASCTVVQSRIVTGQPLPPQVICTK